MAVIMDNVFQKTMVIPATNIKQILLPGFKLKILNKHGSYNAHSSLIHRNVLSGTHVRKWYSDQDDVIRTINNLPPTMKQLKNVDGTKC